MSLGGTRQRTSAFLCISLDIARVCAVSDSDAYRLRLIGGKTVLAENYSRILFSEHSCNVIFSDSPLEAAEKGDTCFVESESLLPYAEKITALTVYRWNRRYPWDKALDVTPEMLGLRLVSTADIEGCSHEKITKEIYEK